MKDLFGIEIPPPAKHPKTNAAGADLHKQLIALHGTAENKCKNCVHFIVHYMGKKFFKCDQSGHFNTGNPRYDWRANWKACGKFQKPLKNNL